MEKKLHPYHETIVTAINNSMTAEALESLGNLIILTKTPKNHDNIIKAWEKKCKELSFEDPFNVSSKLLQQKDEEK